MAQSPTQYGGLRPQITNYPGSQPQGMFGSSTYTPQTSQTGPVSYDFSGITQGANGLQNAPKYNPTQYKPFQFNGPQMGSTGGYGTSDPGKISSVYNQAFSAGAAPIQAQGAERMRQLSQGFGNSGSIGGAAKAELALKNAQQTGSDTQDLARGLSSQIAQTQLGEEATARQADFAEKQDMRNRQYDTAIQNQMNQSNENFRAAGMGDDQSRYYAQDAVNRANQMMQYGFQLPQLQNQLNQPQEQAYQNYMNQWSTLGGFS